MPQPASVGADINRDLYSWLHHKSSLVPAARSTGGPFNGSDVNLKNYEGCAVLIETGAYTDGTHTLKLQEADDNAGSAGSYSDVAAGDLQGAFPVFDGAGKANRNWRVGYIGKKQWVRAVSTVTTTTTGALYSVCIVRGWPRVLPEADIPAGTGDQT